MTLRIQVGERTYEFDESRTVSVGRSAQADVTLPAMSVSRVHAELRPSPTGWVLADAGGQLGTFVDGQRIQEIALQGRLTVQCGPPADGSSFTVIPEPVAAGAPAGAPPAYPSVPSAPPTAPLAGVGPGLPPAPPTAVAPSLPVTPAPGEPYGGQVDAGFEPTYILAGPLPGTQPGFLQPRTGPDLMVEVEDREHRFRHPELVTIGRLPESTIVVSDPVASRAHLRIDPMPGGWRFTNLSREGTFHDGRRVESEVFEEPVTLRLGHPTAGPTVLLVPVRSAEEETARQARKRAARRLRLAGIIGAAALVVVALVVGGLVVFGGGSGGGGQTADAPADDQLTAAELASSKTKTVLISYRFQADGNEYLATGSGSIVGAHGVILTNAHVVAPNAAGLDQYAPEQVQAPTPDYVDVALTNPKDDYATDGEHYRAKVLVADGHIDAAVIQIDADADGNPIDPDTLNLPHYTIGDSDKLQTGDSVTVLGFPAIASLGDISPAEAHPEVTVTTGVISTFIDSKVFGKRAAIDTDARISQGNSGGSAIDSQGQLIGIPSSVVSEQDAAGVSGRIIPVAKVASVLAEGESKAQ